MPWSDSHRTGHAEIDRQHRVLFAMIEDLLRPGEWERRNAAVLELVSYVVQHFAYEESLMQAHPVADAAEHRREHASLTTTATALRDAHACGDVDEALLQRFLREWLRHHIDARDRTLAAAIAANQ
ncbi:MAG: bacteriohemerythrin [Planctomycetes bacterium]|nr:bacteriohemerythrin [Planctomycetota bacterium]